MKAIPPKQLEAAIGLLIPPACREEVLATCMSDTPIWGITFWMPCALCR
jgi:hypothetical protein